MSMRIVLYTEGLEFNGNTLRERALGGSETAFICVARELARMGHTVIAYCICDAEGIYDGVDYRHNSRVTECEQTECDLFICSRFFYTLFQPLRARATILWLHDMVLEENAYWMSQLATRIDAVFCLSEYHVNEVLAMVPALTSHMRLTVNGVDLGEIAEAVEEVGGRKERRIMYTSRPERGLPRALDHYERLNDRSLALVVCSYTSLVGDAVRQVEADCLRRIDDLARRGFPITNASYTKRELYRMMAASLAVIYPMDFPEIFCISAVEAQACGTAFLTTDAFALRETVGYERTPMGDFEAMHARLERVLSDDAYRLDLEARGREHAAKFTWDRVAGAFVEEAERLQGRLREATLPPVVHVQRTVAPAPVPSPYITRHVRRPIRPASPPPPAVSDAAPPRVAATANGIDVRNGAATNGTTGDAALPKISCLCVTLNRLTMLKEAIRCFSAQTYANRELVILTDGSPRYKRAIDDHLGMLGRDDIRLVTLDGEHTLGSLRNRSIAEAAGDIICQWDDDDLYHPHRLAEQAALMASSDARACFLTDHLQLFRADQRVYWIDWDLHRWAPTVWNLVPGTLMMYRDDRYRYPETGTDARMGEDTAFVLSLYDHIPIARLAQKGWLYLYTYHGRNTWDSAHHREMIGIGARAETIREHEADIRQALAHYRIPLPSGVYSGEEAVLVWNGGAN